ncbi:MAG TPA: metalloregulator ArsR/SmtB family transcription factor [Thermomicrobiales bacterium]|nr:metalloregulator ArsR/SmtB family transcription factor [Thermomicrobiales bacterium]
MPNSLESIKADFFKALGHPARIRIVKALRAGELSVGQIQEELGLEQSVVSQQLGVLRAKGLIDPRRSGTSVYYSVADDKVFELLDIARAMFDQQLQSLQAIADEDDARQDGLAETEPA